jgi:hypothetical protein
VNGQKTYRITSDRLHGVRTVKCLVSLRGVSPTRFRKRFNVKTVGLFVRLAAPALVSAGLALAQSAGTEYLGCSNSTLNGSYAFQITGQILAPTPVAGPVAGVALTLFDGNGNLSQVDNVVHNGVAPIEDWRPAIGTYTVNANCTGTFTFTPQPTNPADASPPLIVHFVVKRDGSEIRTGVTSSPASAAFMAAIVSIGVRMN